MLAALTLFGLGLYASVLRLELSSVDEELQRAASTTAFSLKAEEAEGLDLAAAARDTESELRIAGITLAIYDGRGHLLAARWEDLAPTTVGSGGAPEGLSTIHGDRGDWRTLVTRQTYKGTDFLLLNALPLTIASTATSRLCERRFSQSFRSRSRWRSVADGFSRDRRCGPSSNRSAGSWRMRRTSCARRCP